ncbi:MAG: efflux RND transporter permease subunit [Bacteroidota bacterium]
MVRFLINRPTSVFIVYVAFIILSIISIQYLPVSLLPEIDVPRIKILIEGNDRSVNEIEYQILAPLRQKLLQLDGLEDIQSTAHLEKGIIDLQFAYGKDIDYAFLEVHEKIDRAINFLPKDISRPRVVRIRTEDIPAYYLSISFKGEGQDFLSLSRFVRNVVRRRLEQLPEISLTDVHGDTQQEIIIIPNENKMKSLGIATSNLGYALQEQNLTMGSVIFKERNFQYQVRLGQPLQSIQGIKQTPILINGRIFPLEELAHVSLRNEEPKGSYSMNGQAAISLAVIKSSASKLADLTQSLSSVIEQIQNENPSVHVDVVRNNTFLLKHSIQNLQDNLFIGCIASICLVFLFYRNWRLSLLIGLSAPLSILFSLLLFNSLNLSINIITLSGIILGLGLMIDNGIIVLDNIVQEKNERENLMDACVEGTNQMVRPLLASMITTCSVFLPLIFLSGITGSLFYAQAVAISVGLLLSFVVSITFIPVYYYHLAQKQKEIFSPQNWMNKAYSKGLKFVLKHSFLFVVLVLSFLSIGIYTSRQLNVQLLPAMPDTSFEAFIDWNEPITLDTSEARTNDLFELISEDILSYDIHFGEFQYVIARNLESSSSTVLVHIEYQDKNQGEKIRANLTKILARNYPRAHWELRPTPNAFELLFPKDKEDVKVEIYTTEENVDLQKKWLKDFSNNLRAQFPGIVIEQPATEMNLLISPINENLWMYNVERSSLFQQINQSLSSNNVLTINQSQEQVPVIVSDKSSAPIYDLLSKKQIVNNDGQLIPVKHLVRIESIENWKKLYASSKGVYLPLSIKFNQSANYLLSYLENFKDEASNFIFDINSSHYRNRKIILELLLVLAAALGMLYFIMTAQFESFLQPLIILLEIPVSLGGSILFLYLFGSTLNLMAMIGMIVTVGIVINDSIIKVDTINRLRKNGLPIEEAIHKGGIKRLKPIVLTSLTTIIAIMPIFFSNDIGATLQYPLALTLSGGLILGTLMSLYLVPLLYLKFYK